MSKTVVLLLLVYGISNCRTIRTELPPANMNGRMLTSSFPCFGLPKRFFGSMSIGFHLKLLGNDIAGSDTDVVVNIFRGSAQELDVTWNRGSGKSAHTGPIRRMK